MFKFIYRFFDKLEDHVRGWLSHYPILYAIVGGTGIVLFWRGVWHTMDYLMALISVRSLGLTSIDQSLGAWWDGPLSLVLGIVVLLLIGLFVSSFIGNEIIMSGLRGEKKISERTEREVRTKTEAMAEMMERVARIAERMERMEKMLEKELHTVATEQKEAEKEVAG